MVSVVISFCIIFFVFNLGKEALYVKMMAAHEMGSPAEPWVEASTFTSFGSPLRLEAHKLTGNFVICPLRQNAQYCSAGVVHVEFAA